MDNASVMTVSIYYFIFKHRASWVMQAEGLKDDASWVTLIIQAERFMNNASGGQLGKYKPKMLFYSLENAIKFN